jgi:prolyl oligopeptidase
MIIRNVFRVYYSLNINHLMRNNVILFSLSIFIMVSCTTKVQEQKQPLLAKVNLAEDVYFGKKISDPYRYMENLKDPYVQKWIKSQADYSRNVLNSISGRQKLIDKMWDFDSRISSKISLLKITDNNRYFYLKTAPNEETGKIFYKDGFEGQETFLFDPLTFGTDSTQKYVIGRISPSSDGSNVAFTIAKGGSESSILLIMDVKKKKLFPERIDRCTNATASWLPDNKRFLYMRMQSTDVHDENHGKDSKTYMHNIGTDPVSDKEIFSRAKNPDLGINPEDYPRAFYDKDSRLIYGFINTVDRRLNVYYASVDEINNERINWKQLFNRDDEVYDFYATEKDLFIYIPKNAPNFKILKTSFVNPDLTTAEVFVPEDSLATINSFRLTNEGLFYTMLINGVQTKLFYQPYKAKKAEEIELPFVAGSIELKTRGYGFNDVWVEISGWIKDKQRFRYNADKNDFKLENLTDIVEYPEYSDLVVKEVMVESHDGVMVPFSIVHKKGVKRNGNNPVLMYGYGAYGISDLPIFYPNFLLWVKEGGICAMSHVRGGGELGEQWHKAGFKTTKPNTWKDLIACSEYMISEKYTSAKKIAIYGVSAGGILVGRAMTERPDLFAAVIPKVGVMNPLRFEETPNGPVNVPEFGTIKDSIECMALIKMDSYLHLKEGIEYPAALVTAGMNDPRVIAWQPAKFAPVFRTFFKLKTYLINI